MTRLLVMCISRKGIVVCIPLRSIVGSSMERFVSAECPDIVEIYGTPFLHYFLQLGERWHFLTQLKDLVKGISSLSVDDRASPRN